MKKFEFDETVLLIGAENKHGILYGDMFYLRLDNENFFFFVDKTETIRAHVYEMAKKKIKYQGMTVNVLCPKLQKTRNPKIIKDFVSGWCDTDYECIHVFYKYNFYKAIKLTEEKKNGVLNYYWEV